MNKIITFTALLFASSFCHGAALKAQGKIKRLGAMTQSIGFDHFLTLEGLDTLGNCRRAPDVGNLILFRVKKEGGQGAIYSTALAAYMDSRNVEILVRDDDTDTQGSCYIAAISFI